MTKELSVRIYNETPTIYPNLDRTIKVTSIRTDSINVNSTVYSAKFTDANFTGPQEFESVPMNIFMDLKGIYPNLRIKGVRQPDVFPIIYDQNMRVGTTVSGTLYGTPYSFVATVKANSIKPVAGLAWIFILSIFL